TDLVNENEKVMAAYKTIYARQCVRLKLLDAPSSTADMGKFNAWLNELQSLTEQADFSADSILPSLLKTIITYGVNTDKKQTFFHSAGNFLGRKSIDRAADVIKLCKIIGDSFHDQALLTDRYLANEVEKIEKGPLGNCTLADNLLSIINSATRQPAERVDNAP
ncbi:MAG: hypothetical protein ACK4PR_04050, partial [Gammaproteobacteria bacterium]